jgi:RNA polymerase sigma factor (sigma-70 family)
MVRHSKQDDDAFNDLLPLLPKLQQRDPQAQDELARALLRRLPDLVRPQLHNRFPRLRSAIQTDDVAQEVMLSLIVRLFEVPPQDEDHFRATVWVIIRHTLINLVRKEFGPRGWGSNAHLGGSELAEAITTDHRARRDAKLDILLFVAELSDDEADLIISRYFLNKEMEEIAEQHGVDRGTIRRRLNAILVKLGKRFEP